MCFAVGRSLNGFSMKCSNMIVNCIQSERLSELKQEHPDALFVSAYTGKGLTKLMDATEQAIFRSRAKEQAKSEAADYPVD